ncbi:MAG: M20/M25/M40 family metallo-hydrolase [Oscillospiraceae bacterium]
METERTEEFKNSVVLQHLGAAIAIPTVSAPEAPPALARFREFHAFLRQTYPLVHSHLGHEVVAGRSLLYHWKGTGSARLPFAVLGHQDVVPIEEGTEQAWTHPPFSGAVEGGYVWGRGANDMKNFVIAQFEAAEALLAEGFAPARDIYFCYGHNEEILVGENSGARAVADTLQGRGVHLEFVLDEGGAVITDSFLGTRRPFAAIGVAEKGYLDFEVSVEGAGGHAAEPPEKTAVQQLARLLAALPPQKMRLVPMVQGMLAGLARQIKGPVALVLRHAGLFRPLLFKVLSGNNMAKAMLQTTCVPTILAAGTQANVLPQKATAVFNSRILPGETDETLRQTVEKAAKKAKVKAGMRVLRYSPPPKETSPGHRVYRHLAQLAGEIHGAAALPYLVTGATDSREYADVADEIFRFYPFALTFKELGTMHSTDERIACQSVLDAVEFLKRFIRTEGEQTQP